MSTVPRLHRRDQRGPLRERPGALGRAHLVAGFAAEWAGRSDAPEILLSSAIVGLVGLEGAVLPIEPGRRAFLFAGVARPQRFVRDAAAAGIEAALTIEAMRRGLLLPTINHLPDPALGDIDVVPNAARRAAYEIALSNAFGFGGHNAVLVLREFSG